MISRITGEVAFGVFHSRDFCVYRRHAAQKNHKSHNMRNCRMMAEAATRSVTFE
jgi:hypothetical protein